MSSPQTRDGASCEAQVVGVEPPDTKTLMAPAGESLRVLFAMFRDDERAGGSLRVGQTLATGLNRRHVQAEICFAYGNVGPVGREGGARCHYLRVGGSRDVLHWRRFRRLIRRVRPHIVHFIDPSIWMHGMAAGTGVTRILHLHGAVFQEPPSLRDRAGFRFVASQADGFVCITHGVRESLERAGITRRTRAAVVYNGIDFDALQQRPDREEARRLLGVPSDARVMGMVCRLVNTRGCDDFLRILSALDPSWHGLLVGDGPARASLETLARDLGVRDRVTFTGSVADVRPAYATMDAYALLALYDSFGLATAEAMACRVPVFGLAGGGEYREPQNPLVTAENAVFLDRAARREVEDIEDPALLQALARRLTDYGHNPESLQAMVETAWHHVKSRFTQDVQCDAMLDVYRSLLPTAARLAPRGPADVGRYAAGASRA